MPTVVEYVRAQGVAAHMRSTTIELAAWSREYSQIASQKDANRALEMVGYMKTYYVPAAGYRSDAETEAMFENQRRRAIEQIESAVQEWNQRSHSR